MTMDRDEEKRVTAAGPVTPPGDTLAVRILRRYKPDKTLTDIADQVDYSLGMTSMVLSGKRDPSLGKARLFAEALDLNLDEFCALLDELQGGDGGGGAAPGEGDPSGAMALAMV